MLVNNSVTIYHKSFDTTSRLEVWTRYNYNNVWFFEKQGTNINKGYDDNNNVYVRIPYDLNNNIDINNFSIGDIIVEGNLTTNITTQQDLDCDIYNITSITNNKFGSNQHIHLGGK